MTCGAWDVAFFMAAGAFVGCLATQLVAACGGTVDHATLGLLAVYTAAHLKAQSRRRAEGGAA